MVGINGNHTITCSMDSVILHLNVFALDRNYHFSLCSIIYSGKPVTGTYKGVVIDTGNIVILHTEKRP